MSLYVDSVLQGEIETSGTLAIGDEPIRVGGGAPSGRSQLLFNGSIDVRIYDHCIIRGGNSFLYEAGAELPPQSVTSAKLSPALSHLIDGNGSLKRHCLPVQ